MKKFRVVDIDQYEKLKSRNKNIFLAENFQLKRGANRAKLYNRYRKDLVKHFQPPAFVKRKTDDLIQELLKTKTEIGESRIIVGIYLEAEDFEYYRKFKRLEKSMFIINAIRHFR